MDLLYQLYFEFVWIVLLLYFPLKSSLKYGEPRVCNQHGITAYPTSIFFNGTSPHIYSGNHNAEALADFVKDTLRPSVTILNEVNI